MEELYNLLPDYARDLKLNLQNTLRQTELTERQTWGTAVASAIASRNPVLTRVLLSEASRHLSSEELRAAKAAAAVMGMNNVYFRFQHLSGNPRYAQIPSHLRMQVMHSHGASSADFELWCIAVSAINGCEACVSSHEGVLRHKGITEETILGAVRLASVIHGVAAVLDAEAAGV